MQCEVQKLFAVLLKKLPIEIKNGYKMLTGVHTSVIFLNKKQRMVISLL